MVPCWVVILGVFFYLMILILCIDASCPGVVLLDLTVPCTELILKFLSSHCEKGSSAMAMFSNINKPVIYLVKTFGIILRSMAPESPVMLASPLGYAFPCSFHSVSFGVSSILAQCSNSS